MMIGIVNLFEASADDISQAVVEMLKKPYKTAFDNVAVLARNIRPNSEQSQAVANAVAKQITTLDILPLDDRTFEMLAFVISEAGDEVYREKAKEAFFQNVGRLVEQNPVEAHKILQGVQSSYLCDQTMRAEIVLQLIDLCGDDLADLQNLAGKANIMDEDHRLVLLAKIVNALMEKPYDMVQTLRTFCDAADWTKCPVASKAYDVLDIYAQSPSFMAEVLEKEFGVNIVSIPKAANEQKPVLSVID